MDKSLEQIQQEIGEWAFEQFGYNPNRSEGHPGFGQSMGSLPPLLGMGEEVGEINHAYVYRLQGRGEYGDLEKYVHDIKDGLADLLVFACDFANRISVETGEPIILQEVLNQTWEKVSARRRTTWNADKAAESAPAKIQGTEELREVVRGAEPKEHRPSGYEGVLTSERLKAEGSTPEAKASVNLTGSGRG